MHSFQVPKLNGQIFYLAATAMEPLWIVLEKSTRSAKRENKAIIKFVCELDGVIDYKYKH